jgi:hypothetical protein
MPIDLAAAERFIHANARLIDRHRATALLHGASPAPVLQALRAYRNADGGFGHALEPDVRGPHSEAASTSHALEILIQLGWLDDAMLADAATWTGTIADADGGIPFVLPATADYPHAPWMVPSHDGSHLTFALAGQLWETRSNAPWLARGTDWCWAKLESSQVLDGYWIKFALEFLDHVAESTRAEAAIDRFRRKLGEDGSIPVPDGIEGERLRPLDLSPRPGLRSRALFSARMIEADLDRLEHEQQSDGGWEIDFLKWSPAQAVEWRGMMTLRALTILAAHHRLPRPRASE